LFDNVLKLVGMDYESKMKRKLESCLSQLPICSSRVVIGSPMYDPEIFNCEVIIESSDLLEWVIAQQLERSTSFFDEVLLAWLPNADLNDMNLTYLGEELLRSFDGYEERLINLGIAKVICEDCHSEISNIIQDRENTLDEGNWHSGIIVWKCPNGHQIYRKGYRIHALSR